MNTAGKAKSGSWIGGGEFNPIKLTLLFHSPSRRSCRTTFWPRGARLLNNRALLGHGVRKTPAVISSYPIFADNALLFMTRARVCFSISTGDVPFVVGRDRGIKYDGFADENNPAANGTIFLDFRRTAYKRLGRARTRHVSRPYTRYTLLLFSFLRQPPPPSPGDLVCLRVCVLLVAATRPPWRRRRRRETTASCA